MRLSDGQELTSHITSSSVIHIYGAGLNQDRPAHTAVKELSERGWAIAPIHPRDGGATIDGFPIRPELDSGIIPRIVVLFLAPERARAVVRNLIIRISKEEFPVVWFQLKCKRFSITIIETCSYSSSLTSSIYSYSCNWRSVSPHCCGHCPSH